MTNVVGRPIAPLVLSSDERAYLERQVRRRRVARSLSLAREYLDGVALDAERYAQLTTSERTKFWR